jgi:hypothetical protein
MAIYVYHGAKARSITPFPLSQRERELCALLTEITEQVP